MSLGSNIAGARGQDAPSRLPWSAYALHHSDDGLWSVHIASCAALLLAELNAELCLDEFSLWNVNPKWGLVSAVPLRRRDLLMLDQPLEILHAPAPGPLLRLDPAPALHQHLAALPNSRFAISLADGDRGVLYTRDAHIAGLAVRLLLAGLFTDLSGAEALPSLDDASLQSLLHTVPHGQWEELELTQLNHGWKATFSSNGTPTRHWLGPAGGAWRTDWTW